MASIDERVVSMSFDNAKFEAGVAETMATLAQAQYFAAEIGKVTGLPEMTRPRQKITFKAL